MSERRADDNREGGIGYLASLLPRAKSRLTRRVRHPPRARHDAAAASAATYAACLERSMPLLRAPRTDGCAVVGSSDVLRFYPMGDAVEASTTIWRVNHAPAGPWFGAYAGNRTDVRLLNHVTEDTWMGKLKPKQNENMHGDEFPRNLCDKSMCIGLYDSRTFLNMPKKREACRSPGHGATSAGFLTVMAALRSCSGTVHLYGFHPHCCKMDALYPGLRYKYYHTDKSKWVCCSRGREDMGWEYGQYVAHKRLRLHLVKTRVGSPRAPRCALVGSARSPHSHGARIDAADRVYRVDGTPTRGYEALVGSRTDVRTFSRHTMATASGGNNSQYGCGGTTRCVLIREYGDLNATSGAVAWHTTDRLANISLADEEFTRYALTFKSQFTATPPKRIKLSAGLATALYALSQCSSVEVFRVGANGTCCGAGSSYYSSTAPRISQRSNQRTNEDAAWAALPVTFVA